MLLLHTLTNKTPIYSTWGLLSVCATCPTPRLNQSYELRPPWERHLRYVPHRVRNGYNNICTDEEQLIYCCHWKLSFNIRQVSTTRKISVKISKFSSGYRWPTVFWDMTSGNMVAKNWRFTGKYCAEDKKAGPKYFAQNRTWLLLKCHMCFLNLGKSSEMALTCCMAAAGPFDASGNK